MEDDRKQQIKDANTMLGAGAGLATFGAGSAMLLGSVCPLCIIAAPVLVGIGVVGRIRAGKQQKAVEGDNDLSEERADAVSYEPN